MAGFFWGGSTRPGFPGFCIFEFFRARPGFRPGPQQKRPEHGIPGPGWISSPGRVPGEKLIFSPGRKKTRVSEHKSRHCAGKTANPCSKWDRKDSFQMSILRTAINLLLVHYRQWMMIYKQNGHERLDWLDHVWKFPCSKSWEKFFRLVQCELPSEVQMLIYEF